MRASARTATGGSGSAGPIPAPRREGPRPPPRAPLTVAPPRPESVVLAGLSGAPRRRRVGATAISLGAHLVVVAAAVLVTALVPVTLPVQPRDPLLVLIFDPPPPPPLPLPRGDPLLPRTGRAPARRAEPTPAPVAPTPTPALLPRAVVPADLTPPSFEASPAGGSDTGSDRGVPEGMEGGVPEGQVGGVPGGVVGGVVGGRLGGLVPVRDYDQAPRLLRSVKPTYPQEAFVKKIEGTVLLEILIDEHGRVVSARVRQSIPLLDAAAIAAVKQWLFQPAVRRGRPVPTVADAPISFRIF